MKNKNLSQSALSIMQKETPGKPGVSFTAIIPA
jgi:hypothetical protein